MVAQRDEINALQRRNDSLQEMSVVSEARHVHELAQTKDVMRVLTKVQIMVKASDKKNRIVKLENILDLMRKEIAEKGVVITDPGASKLEELNRRLHAQIADERENVRKASAATEEMSAVMAELRRLLSQKDARILKLDAQYQKMRFAADNEQEETENLKKIIEAMNEEMKALADKNKENDTARMNKLMEQNRLLHKKIKRLEKTIYRLREGQLVTEPDREETPSPPADVDTKIVRKRRGPAGTFVGNRQFNFILHQSDNVGQIQFERMADNTLKII